MTIMEPEESVLPSTFHISYDYSALRSCGPPNSVHVGEVSDFFTCSCDPFPPTDMRVCA